MTERCDLLRHKDTCCCEQKAKRLYQNSVVQPLLTGKNE